VEPELKLKPTYIFLKEKVIGTGVNQRLTLGSSTE
jgi:hypothetical protein